MPTHVHPIDIAVRLYRFNFKSLFHFYPECELVGEAGSFGKLQVQMNGRHKDFALYIDDVDAIMDAVEDAMTNFQKLILEYQEYRG